MAARRPTRAPRATGGADRALRRPRGTQPGRGPVRHLDVTETPVAKPPAATPLGPPPPAERTAPHRVALETRLDGAGFSIAAARPPARRAAASGQLTDMDDGTARRQSSIWPQAVPSIQLDWSQIEGPRQPTAPLPVLPAAPPLMTLPPGRLAPVPPPALRRNLLLTGEIRRAFRRRPGLRDVVAVPVTAVRRLLERLFAAVLNIR
jgi:hypothetical protein